MKKLLCVLMFGMMFGQTKLETRVYDFEINFTSGDVYYPIDMYDITGYDLKTAIFQVIGLNDYQYSGHVQIDYDCDNMNVYGTSMFAYHNGNLTFYSENIYLENKNCKFVRQTNNDSFIRILQLAITAEFPQEETGYIDEGFDYCINVGANLLSSPCSEEIAITEAIPSEIANNLTGIITQGGATSQIAEGVWVGSLNGLGGGKGYWFLSQIEGCFNYTCSE